MCSTSTFWKCVCFENMGSVTKVMSMKVKNVTWRFPLEWSNDLSEESLPISTLSWSRIVSCGASAFYALSHSLPICWHSFCHAREWQASDISHATRTLSRPNGAKIMVPRWRHVRAKNWETKRVNITLPSFCFLIPADLTPKTILSRFSIFRDP